VKILCSLFLKVLGWRVVDNWPKDIKKAILIGLPHTSNWDFFLSMAYFIQVEIPYRFTIKKEWMRFPFSIILKKLGALSIDRTNKKGTVSYISDYIKELSHDESFFMLVTPEGTRSKVQTLKTGFYQMAIQAGVPILFGFVDYGKKEIGIGSVLHPSGNYKEDLEVIKNFYRNKKPKYPKRFDINLRPS